MALHKDVTALYNGACKKELTGKTTKRPLGQITF